MSDTNELNDDGVGEAAQQSNPFKPMTSTGLQEEIWRKEAELLNIERKRKESKRSSLFTGAAFLFVGIFGFIIAAGFWQVLAGIVLLLGGLVFLMGFVPDSEISKEEGELEADLYVLRNRWNQSMLD